MGNPADTGTIITLFSARGATGKTPIAINLAAALAQETGQRVALVDLDVRFGDVAISMDIPVERSLADLVAVGDEIAMSALEQCVYVHNTGVSVLPAPIRPTEWRKIEPRHVQRIVALLAENYDLVILDTPGTFNDIVVRALEMATTVLLVCTADDRTLEDTRQAIDYLRSASLLDRTKLVVNSINGRTEMDPQDIERILSVDVFSSVPYDRNISGTQFGTPLVVSHPDSPAAESMRQLADALIVQPAGQASKAPATVPHRTRSQTPRRDQSREVEQIILHTAEGYAESRRAGIGVADDGRAWIRFFDYPPETKHECSLCRKRLDFGWRDVDNTEFICEQHVEFSDKRVSSAQVEKMRKAESALASLASQAGATLQEDNIEGVEAPPKAGSTKLECNTCGRELTREDLEFHEVAEDDGLEFYEGLLTCRQCEESPDTEEDTSANEEEDTSAVQIEPAAPEPQSISEQAATVVGVVVAAVATIVLTILGFLWIWSAVDPGAAILAAIFLWTIPATLGYWVGVAVVAPLFGLTQAMRRKDAERK